MDRPFIIFFLYKNPHFRRFSSPARLFAVDPHTWNFTISKVKIIILDLNTNIILRMQMETPNELNIKLLYCQKVTSCAESAV